jgi:hypothetical protein
LDIDDLYFAHEFTNSSVTMNKITIGITGLLSGLLVAGLFQCKQLEKIHLRISASPLQEQNEARRTVAPVTVISTSEEAIKLFEDAAPSVVYITTAVEQDYWSRNI